MRKESRTYRSDSRGRVRGRKERGEKEESGFGPRLLRNDDDGNQS